MILHGDCLERLRELADNSVDSIVTDPPYGLSFMGKKWDYDVPSVDVWRECLRVLKPGGHILVACGTRTQHRMAVNIEDAGFQVRDVITWLYGSGFPKSLDVSKAIDKASGYKRERIPGGQGGVNSILGSRKTGEAISGEAKQWQGFGTALKPACEFWTLARKPLGESTVAKNVLKYGTGGINVDGCRVETFDNLNGGAYSGDNRASKNGDILKIRGDVGAFVQPQGRFPANLILDEIAAEMLGEPSRFFYVAKASKSERNAGLDSAARVVSLIECENKDALTVAVQLLQRVTSELTVKWLIAESGKSISAQCPMECKSTTLMALKQITESKILNALMLSLTNGNTQDVNSSLESGGSLAANVESLRRWILNTTNGSMGLALGASSVASKTLQSISEKEDWPNANNFHSTVKPVKLMRYLCRLITPPGGTVLDPFMGSGTTGVAALNEGFNFVGIEREVEYVTIAERRIGSAKKE